VVNYIHNDYCYDMYVVINQLTVTSCDLMCYMLLLCYKMMFKFQIN